MRRFGRPGLLGTVARTAVVAGTAAATANAVNRRRARFDQQAAEAAAYQQERATGPTTPAPPPDDDLIGDQLAKLAHLHASGALDDSEFAAAKRQLLG